MPHSTSIAGRHAADRQRARAADAVTAVTADAQFDARKALAYRLERAGLHTFADIIPRPNVEPTLALRCRVDSCEQDHARIYAILDEMGWKSDVNRLSRINHRYDILRLVHPATGATLVLIITLPAYQVSPWEAA
jgi:hypothetical protein